MRHFRSTKAQTNEETVEPLKQLTRWRECFIFLSRVMMFRYKDSLATVRNIRVLKENWR